MRNPKPPVSHIRIVAAIITDARRHVLLVRKQGTSYFMQPGGKAEAGERATETLAREIREELGCWVRPGGMLYTGRFLADAANEPGFKVDAELYMAELCGTPVAQAEIAELTWLNADNREGLKLAPLTGDFVLPMVRSGP